ncbi:HNH endonuclease [Roseixanthobacter glucoisosaccharinicivorans]|uniref:HNH endonuclease n=1 Tax=Roseixanthobacter glucoisosaccharinicivorans TaxID=3119923 RepID=UPI00372CF914
MANKFTKIARYAAAVGTLCPYCKREMAARAGLTPTLDHVHPRSKGGQRTVWACDDCNRIKRDMTESEWSEYRAHNPSWW